MAIIEFGTGRSDVDFEADARVDVGDAATDLPESVATVDETPQREQERRGLFAGLDDRLSGRWAAGLITAWVAIFTAGVLLEPPPADPDAALAPLEGVLVAMLLLGWVVMAAGFATRRRYGVVASLVAAAGLVGMTIACQVSGHHTGIGAWWWFQAAGATALVALSVRALKTA